MPSELMLELLKAHSEHRKLRKELYTDFVKLVTRYFVSGKPQTAIAMNIDDDLYTLPLLQYFKLLMLDEGFYLDVSNYPSIKVYIADTESFNSLVEARVSQLNDDGVKPERAVKL